MSDQGQSVDSDLMLSIWLDLLDLDEIKRAAHGKHGMVVSLEIPEDY